MRILLALQRCNLFLLTIMLEIWPDRNAADGQQVVAFKLVSFGSHA